MRLEGKVALVTGGSRSIGRAIALGLAREGASVAVSYVSHAEAARSAACEIEALGRRALAIRADSSQRSQVRAMVEEIETTLLGDGTVRVGDVLVIISGAPMWVTGTTNLLKVHRVGEHR